MRLKLYRAVCTYCHPGYLPRDIRPITACVKLPSGTFACVAHANAIQQTQDKRKADADGDD